MTLPPQIRLVIYKYLVHTVAATRNLILKKHDVGMMTAQCRVHFRVQPHRLPDQQPVHHRHLHPPLLKQSVMWKPGKLYQ